MFEIIGLDSSKDERVQQYQTVKAKIEALLTNEDDWVSAMATVSCELHNSFEYFHWTGFYRCVSEKLLKIGPYQGSHGCLQIPLGKGVCGTVAAERKSILLDDVNSFSSHIACSATTQSELVVPVIAKDGACVAVIDIDSDHPAAFTEVDQLSLEDISKFLSLKYFNS